MLKLWPESRWTVLTSIGAPLRRAESRSDGVRFQGEKASCGAGDEDGLNVGVFCNEDRELGEEMSSYAANA